MTKKKPQKKRTRKARGSFTIGRKNPYTRGSPVTINKKNRRDVSVRQKTTKEMLDI